MNKARLDKTCTHWVNRIYSDLRTGYVMAALKMHINNKTLRLKSVLDPDFVGHSQTEKSLKMLAERIPQAFVIPGLF